MVRGRAAAETTSKVSRSTKTNKANQLVTRKDVYEKTKLAAEQLNAEEALTIDGNGKKHFMTVEYLCVGMPFYFKRYAFKDFAARLAIASP